MNQDEIAEKGKNEGVIGMVKTEDAGIPSA
jgi:hypothetical protein